MSVSLHEHRLGSLRWIRPGSAAVAPVAIPLADLAEGNPRAQSNFDTADRGEDS